MRQKAEPPEWRQKRREESAGGATWNGASAEGRKVSSLFGEASPRLFAHQFNLFFCLIGKSLSPSKGIQILFVQT